MKRREFAAAPSESAALLVDWGRAKAHRLRGREAERTFKFHFAPHPSLFRHHAGDDYLDQIKFAADCGFTAWEDHGMMGRPVELQEKAAEIMAERGVAMGSFMGYASFNQPTFSHPTSDSQHMLRERMGQILICARRTQARWVTVVPGTMSPQRELAGQAASVIETLKMCCEILAPEGVVMVLKPQVSSPHQPDYALTTLPQAYKICRAVASPSCKLLVDLGVSAMTPDNLDAVWSETAYLQSADDHEPGSPEILRFLDRNDFQGVIGMEHAHPQEDEGGELELIQAYRQAENFEQ
jgi:hydroxypyruvate isomerase